MSNPFHWVVGYMPPHERTLQRKIEVKFQCFFANQFRKSR